MQDLFDAVKKEVGIAEHVSRFESDLRPEGGALVGSHHRHGSYGGRCLHVDTAENQFNCFSCRAGGSVIDYEANRLGIDLYSAAEALADKYGVDRPDETPEQRETRGRQWADRERVQELMFQAFTLYHECMTPKQRQYFTGRGISDEVIDNDLLGYAPDSNGARWLTQKLYKKTGVDDPNLLLATGLFFQNDGGKLSDRYRDRYIFPYWMRDKIVFSIGRSINPNIENHKKYVKHLVRSDRYPYVSEQAVKHVLWGQDKITKGANILIVEGIVDAIAARQYFGDRFAIVSPITVQPSKKQMQQLARLTIKAKSITIIGDAELEDKGEKGVLRSAKMVEAEWSTLQTEDVPVYPPLKIARLRRPPEVEKIDVADYLTSELEQELDYWISAAQPLHYHQQRLEGNAWRFFTGKNGTDFVAKRVADECKLESNYFLFTADHLYHYQDGVYQPNGDTFIRQYTKNLLGEKWTATRYQAVLDWLQDPVEPDDINSDPNILNVQNGLLVLDETKLRLHTPYYFSTARIPVDFRADAAWETDNYGKPIINCETGRPNLTKAGKAIQKFIVDVVPYDCVELVYEMAGYCLWSRAKYDMGFILIGSGANGKGTLLNLITDMLGKGNISNVSAQDLCESRFKSAELLDKLANICADIPSNPLKDPSPIKMITSGDYITTERKFGHPFAFRPSATLLFSANEIPQSRDKTYAFYRRWRFIPFPNRFEGNERDANIIDTLTTPDNLAAFLALSIRGLKRLWDQGEFTQSESAEQVMTDYKARNDSVAAFIEECVEVKPGEIVTRSTFYERYKEFCEGNGFRYVSNRRFNPAVEGHIPSIERKDSKRPVAWEGVTLKDC